MRKITIFLLCSLIFCSIYCQTNSDASQKLTKDLEQIYSQGHIVGFSVAIINDNGSLYSNGFGFSDKVNNKIYTENTIQNIASISKTFIGIATNTIN